MRAHAQNSRPGAAPSKSEGRDGFQELFDLIGELARRRYQAGERGFAALGLNHTEARLLTLLAREGGTAAQDALCGQLTVDRTNAGRALQRLETAGLVARKKDRGDQRAKTVRLTAEGRKMTRAIAYLRAQIARSFFGALTPQEAAGAAALFRRLLSS